MKNHLAILEIIPHQEDLIIYKYVSLGTAIAILNNGTLLFQTPFNFNDPFDLHMGLLDFTVKDVDGFWEDMRTKKSHAVVDFLMEGATLEMVEGSFMRTFEATRREMGILCLSKTPLSTLMWSHYSDKHTGICLGFRIPNGRPENKTMAFDVKYSSEVIPMSVDWRDTDMSMVAVINWICTKANAWNYEKEVRVINLDYTGIAPFETEQLQEVYYGVMTEPSQVKIINEILTKKGYSPSKLCKMTINKKHFNLEPKAYAM